MEITSPNPLTDPQWDGHVEKFANGTFFHTSAWARVLTKTYGHVPSYILGSVDRKCVALLPMLEVRSPWTGRRGVCLPFTDACSTLAIDSATAEAVTAHAFQLARARGWKHVEFRGGIKPSPTATPSVSFLSHSLDLRDGPAVVLSRFDSAVRRAIRKAERSNLKVELLRSREAVLAYYQLHVRTRKRHGLPPQPLDFFLNIHSEVLEAGAGFIALATQGSIPVAGAVFFHFNQRAIYKFGASDEDQLDLRGNNLVMWQAIRFLSENGFASLDFGRTSLNNDGLRRFKKSWGTHEGTIEYFQFETATQRWVTSRDRASGMHNAVFSRLPSSLNRLAGTIIYPHLD